MRIKKEKTPTPIKLPPTLPFNTWVVFGLDLSLSRTGYSIGVLTKNDKDTSFKLTAIGSLKPEVSSIPVWLRSSLTARSLLDQLCTPDIVSLLDNGAGLLVCLEAFTPQNDFLSSINRVVHATFFSAHSPLKKYPSHILSVNASTLRSLMGLTKTGAKNKQENIAKAYTFIDRSTFPELDTDSCDALLLSIVGSYAGRVLLGVGDTVPEKFLIALCNGTQEVKGKGANAKIITKGLFHRTEYWYVIKETELCMMKKDATSRTKKLTKLIYPV